MSDSLGRRRLVSKMPKTHTLQTALTKLLTWARNLLSDKPEQHRLVSKMPRSYPTREEIDEIHALFPSTVDNSEEFAAEMKEARDELDYAYTDLHNAEHDPYPLRALEHALSAWYHAHLAYCIYNGWDEDEAREGTVQALYAREEALMAISDRLTSEVLDAAIEERLQRTVRIDTWLGRFMDEKLGNNPEPAPVPPHKS